VRALVLRMTYRDPAPSKPACPVCESPDDVRTHSNPNQGRWLCFACMFLFTSVTDAPTALPARSPVPEEIARARAALRGGRA
jgi:transposase-like protein